MRCFGESYFHVAIAALAAVFLSTRQFRYFDCNKMPAVSVIAGAITLFLVYVMAVAFFRILTTPNPTRARLRAAWYVGSIGGALLLTAGMFTMVSHLCP
jgi:hypothetical protein